MLLVMFEVVFFEGEVIGVDMLELFEGTTLDELVKFEVVFIAVVLSHPPSATRVSKAELRLLAL